MARLGLLALDLSSTEKICISDPSINVEKEVLVMQVLISSLSAIKPHSVHDKFYRIPSNPIKG